MDTSLMKRLSLNRMAKVVAVLAMASLFVAYIRPEAKNT